MSHTRRIRDTLFTGTAIVSLGLLVACGDSTTGDGETTARTDATGVDNGDNSACELAPEYPSGTIDLIVPYAAGGGTDNLARGLAEQLSQSLDARVSVVNRAGGNSVIGNQEIATASDDGHTIGLVAPDVVTTYAMGQTDFSVENYTAISLVNEDPSTLTVSTDSEWDTAGELLESIEANPGGLNGSGTGAGGIYHIAMLEFLDKAGLEHDDVQWVPSEGAAPGLQELVAGGVDVVTNSLGENLTMLEGDRVKALAVMSSERSGDFPEVPTVEEELGFEANLTVWRGLLGPENMDPEVAAKLDCHVKKITEGAEFQEFMSNVSMEINYLPADEFSEFMDAGQEKLINLVEGAGLAD